MDTANKNNSAKIDPQKMGYYSYEEVASVLGISLRSVSNYCVKFHITPKTGITNNRSKFLTRKDIIDIYVNLQKKNNEDADISAIKWNKIEEKISATAFAEIEKKEGLQKTEKEESIIDIDVNSQKDSKGSEDSIDTSKKSGRPLMPIEKEFLQLKQEKGYFEATVNYQGKELTKLEKKNKFTRLFLLMTVVAFIFIFYWVFRANFRKDEDIAELDTTLQKTEYKTLKLESELKFAEKSKNLAEKQAENLQKINDNYKEILDSRKADLQKMEKILQMYKMQEELSDK